MSCDALGIAVICLSDFPVDWGQSGQRCRLQRLYNRDLCMAGQNLFQDGYKRVAYG